MGNDLKRLVGGLIIKLLLLLLLNIFFNKNIEVLKSIPIIGSFCVSITAIWLIWALGGHHGR